MKKVTMIYMVNKSYEKEHGVLVGVVKKKPEEFLKVNFPLSEINIEQIQKEGKTVGYNSYSEFMTEEVQLNQVLTS